MKTFIDFGSKRIHYTLEYSARKSLGIAVTPEMGVLVKVPLSAMLTQVNEKVRKPATSKKIHYTLQYPARKFLGITVCQKWKLCLKPTLAATLKEVNEKLRKRAPWILKLQSFFLSYYPKPPQINSFAANRIYILVATTVYGR